jgi:hypothetical protein
VVVLATGGLGNYFNNWPLRELLQQLTVSLTGRFDCWWEPAGKPFGNLLGNLLETFWKPAGNLPENMVENILETWFNNCFEN